MYFREPIVGRAAISERLGVDCRTFTQRVQGGAVAADGPLISGQQIIPGLRRDGPRYVQEPTFRLPDSTAPMHALLPRETHCVILFRDNEVFSTLEVSHRGLLPWITLAEPPGARSGSHEWAIQPLDVYMKPITVRPDPIDQGGLLG